MYITNIKLTDVRCIKELNIDLTQGSGAKKWLLIIGNNGVGKTSFLISLAIGLCDETGAFSLLQDTSGHMIRAGAESATIEIQLADEGETYTITTNIVQSGNFEVIDRKKTSKDIPWGKIFACGYGANRPIEGQRVQEQYASADALYTLFNYKWDLLNPELMLRRRAKNDAEKNEICKWLADILLLKEGSVDLDDSGILIRKSLYDTYWGSMADGFEATITMILDMLGWAMLAGKTKKKNTLQGIMLIDELEQHLHPALQRSIVDKLHKNFPNIQFIASSHSPICAAGLADLPDKECSLELLAERQEGFVTNESLSTMRGWRYDQVLTSDAFGTPNRNVKTEELMNQIQKLYLKEHITKDENTTLKRLLKKLKNESPVGLEDENICMTKIKINRIRKKLERSEND